MRKRKSELRPCRFKLGDKVQLNASADAEVRLRPSEAKAIAHSGLTICGMLPVPVDDGVLYLLSFKQVSWTVTEDACDPFSPDSSSSLLQDH